MFNLKSNSLKINCTDNLPYISFFDFDNSDEVVACFTTRFGGVSRGKYASMNMSFSNGDDNANVLENFKWISATLGLDYKKLVFSHQTHTTNLKVITQEDIGKGIIKDRDYSDIDGILTNLKGVGLVTQFADCVPLLFYDKNNKAIAASHAGWRGTVGEIARKTVEKMTEVFGSNPKDILVAIAPSICKNCYEVDDIVINDVKKIKGLDLKKIIEKKENGKYLFDLWECNRQILINANILEKNITITDLCTNCNSHIFHSHRATNGIRGNNAAIIALK